jgi:hypothetical protein
MHVHRTKRGRLLEYWVLMFMNVRPYRCGKCRLRFYGPKKLSDDKEPYKDSEAAAADETSQPNHVDSASTRSSRR